MLAVAGMLMLMLANGVSSELYDDNESLAFIPDEDITSYDDEDYDYSDPEQYRPELRAVAIQHLYELFSKLNRNNDYLKMKYRPKFSMVQNPIAKYGPIPYDQMVQMEMKEAAVKRLMNAPETAPVNKDHKVKPIVSKEPKMKGRKIRRVGSHMVCYFKLCAFRPPN